MTPINPFAGAFAGIMIFIFALAAIVTIIVVISEWILWEKAKQPGWAAIIPVYATIIRLKVAGKPMTWLIWLMQFYLGYGFYFLFLYTQNPFFALIYFASAVVRLIFTIMTLNGISKAFGKDEGYTVGLVFLPFIFLPILAFGQATFKGPGGKPTIDDTTIQPNVY